MDVINNFVMQPSVGGQHFIIRLSLPDYATECYDIKMPGLSLDAGKLGIRKLSRYEKDVMLGEVVVRASTIAFVNKGDTLQYNADAFQTAQGSMLDAIIEQMPGVELRDDGRIYVNGRFVDKLLLDGKDFFKDNQLVLLQNLPAYSVKNIKVYEKADGITEVLGKGAADESNKSPYVMDVTLKKGYNAGWIANAEAGYGTHSRYRGRAFGLGYTKSLRVSAYGIINNLNETREPGRSGEWSPAQTTDGITSTKGGGLEIGVFKNNNEYTANVVAKYQSTDKDVITARENFMSGGNTYLRSWDARHNSDREIMMEHSLILRPKEGNRYHTKIVIDGGNVNQRSKSRSVQATFDQSPSSLSGLRDTILAGMAGGLGMLNRYMDESRQRYNQWGASWMQQSTVRFGNYNNGLTISSDGYYNRTTTKASDQNLLQYVGSPEQVFSRENPQASHAYKYWVGVRPQIRLSSVFNLQPLLAFCHWYEYKSNQWYYTMDNLESAKIIGEGRVERTPMLPSMMRDAMMRLDPTNSYVTGLNHTHQYGQLSFTYYKEKQKDGKKYSSLRMGLYGGVNHINRKLVFDGENHQVVKRDYLDPEASCFANWESPKLNHRVTFDYRIQGTGLDLMNLVDMIFSSDPLNLRQGNPDLKLGINQRISASYQCNRRLFGRLLLGTSVNYDFTSRKVAMSYAYNRETGVRISKPVNVDGCRNVDFAVSANVNLTRDGKLTLQNYMWNLFSHYVDMISYDAFISSQKTAVNDYYLWNNLGIQYNIGKHMVGFDAMIDTHHTTSDDPGFKTLNTPSFNYGFRGRVVLPYAIELSTDIKMYQRRGHDDPMMNINTLLWDARASKSLLNGQLIVSLDGYDILGNVKSIGYSINSMNRTETWTASIPSYVMFTLRWNFAKKPRE